MVNNIGKTTQILNTELGTTNSFTTTEDITILTGEIGNGFLLFDSNGTLGIISNYTDETNFIVTTYAVSIDIQKILNLNY